MDKQKNITMAVLAYIVFFVPLLTSAKNDPFVKFHVKQGLVLLITGLICGIIIDVLPGVTLIIAPVLDIALLVLTILGISNASKGKEKELPIIGKYAKEFKF